MWRDGNKDFKVMHGLAKIILNVPGVKYITYKLKSIAIHFSSLYRYRFFVEPKGSLGKVPCS